LSFFSAFFISTFIQSLVHKKMKTELFGSNTKWANYDNTPEMKINCEAQSIIAILLAAMTKFKK